MISKKEKIRIARKHLRVNNRFTMLSLVMVLQMYTYVKSYHIVHFSIHFLVCQLNLNKTVSKKKGYCGSALMVQWL